ncbi:protein of unknown function [Methylocaldum szegediense]|uniref:Uncharacterized protein n=1 Tax=Methylocaldum szegediense TaxID=73780 RepID=A0ABM9I0H3_9GAMM|nr:protein of unknown function [Methylocaldum szegediense]
MCQAWQGFGMTALRPNLSTSFLSNNRGTAQPLDEAARSLVAARFAGLSEQGFPVLAVASRDVGRGRSACCRERRESAGLRRVCRLFRSA